MLAFKRVSFNAVWCQILYRMLVTGRFCNGIKVFARCVANARSHCPIFERVRRKSRRMLSGRKTQLQPERSFNFQACPSYLGWLG